LIDRSLFVAEPIEPGKNEKGADADGSYDMVALETMVDEKVINSTATPVRSVVTGLKLIG
jgi:hypothetical protein